MNRVPISSSVVRSCPIALGVLGLLSAGPVRGAGAQAAPIGSSHLVAVIPFDRLGGEPAHEWMGVGLAETLSGILSQAGLSVLSPGIVRRALSEGRTDDGITPSDPVERLRLEGATHVVRGAVQHLGARIRVTARIVHLPTGTVTEGARVDGTSADVFAAQDEVGAWLAEAARRFAGATQREDDAS